MTDPKTILLTGATDGIGLVTAKRLVAMGHHVLLHGRSAEKLDKLQCLLPERTECYVADLSNLAEVAALAKEITDAHHKIDVLVNNAGILKTAEPSTEDGLDVRFVVNTIAPYLLTKRLMPVLKASSRVINLSSAAQASVDLQALAGPVQLTDMGAYSQSKLAITMWSFNLANSAPAPVIIAVNPGSLLATKMVKEGFGVAGHDIDIGANILIQAAFSDTFATASGQYFDNDSGQFAPPHPDALDPDKCAAVVEAIEAVLAKILCGRSI